ncbi:hypothetical protein BVC80_339g9 [Macleaya cordata]|uniref:Uncharacterized protein n=1 Tax=Macleaya cordata TaxID=56857 RepID=A0A200QCC9_MACCD|nr:hypothetical protein BVC80_339g9 [Macleaya cordata]
MEKLIEKLRKTFLDLVQGLKACTICRIFPNKGIENEDEPKLNSVQVQKVVVVQERAIGVAAVRSAKRPGVPKGPPRQTN